LERTKKIAKEKLERQIEEHEVNVKTLQTELEAKMEDIKEKSKKEVKSI